MASILSLFRADNRVIDLGQWRIIIRLTGFLSNEAATSAAYRKHGTVNEVTVQNAVHYRDILRNTREGDSAWSLEAASGNWGTGTLDAGEQDAGTNRTRGKVRLIYDKRWDEGGGAFSNLFFYGTIGDLTFGPRPASTLQSRIDFGLTFLVGEVSA